MGNSGVSRSSGMSTTDKVVPAADAGAASDNPDQAKDAYVVYVLAEKLGKENGTIQLKQLAVWNYLRLYQASTHNPEQPLNGKYKMYAKSREGTPVQLGICHPGPFGAVTGDNNEITFTGKDAKFTMSNKDPHNNKMLYLSSCKEGKIVKAFYEHNGLDDNSYFSIWMRPEGFSKDNGATCIFFVVNQPKLAFWYDDRQNVVKTKPFNNSDLAFQFQLTRVDLSDVEFINNN